VVDSFREAFRRNLAQRAVLQNQMTPPRQVAPSPAPTIPNQFAAAKAYAAQVLAKKQAATSQGPSTALAAPIPQTRYGDTIASVNSTAGGPVVDLGQGGQQFQPGSPANPQPIAPVQTYTPVPGDRFAAPQAQELRFLAENMQEPSGFGTPQQMLDMSFDQTTGQPYVPRMTLAEYEAAKAGTVTPEQDQANAQAEVDAAAADQATEDAAVALEIAQSTFNADPSTANKDAVDAAQKAYTDALAISGEPIPGVEQVFNLIDTPRQLVIEEMGNNAYDVAVGEKDDWSAEVAAIAPANWIVPGLDGTRLSQDFEAWVEDPDNWAAIRNAKENGFQASLDAPRYEGGRAVWELFINGAGNAYKAVMDILLDPLVLFQPLADVGTGFKATAALDAQEALRTGQGIGPWTVIKQVGGTALQAPQAVMNVTGDLPFTIAGEAISRAGAGVGRPGWVRNLLSESPTSRAATQGEETTDTLGTYHENVRGGPNDIAPGPGGTTSPPPQGGTGTGPGQPTGNAGQIIPPQTPEATVATTGDRFTMRQEGNEWVVYNPQGVPTGDRFPAVPRAANDIEPNWQERQAAKHVNQLNQPLIQADLRSQGWVLPPEINQLTFTSPTYQPLTNRGQALPYPNVQIKVASDATLGTPELRTEWLQEFVPKAAEHERVMGEIRTRETAAMQQSGGSIEREYVQRGREIVSPPKTLEIVRFVAEDAVAPFKRTFPGADLPPYRFTTNATLDTTDINNVIEHAVFGTADTLDNAGKVVEKGTATQARAFLNSPAARSTRIASLDGMTYADLATELRRLRVETGEPLSLHPNSIAKREAAARAAALPQDQQVAAAVGDLNLPAEPSITAAPEPDLPEPTVATAPEPPALDPIATPQPKKKSGPKPRVPLDMTGDDRAIRNLIDTGAKWVSPNDNLVTRGSNGKIDVRTTRTASGSEWMQLTPIVNPRTKETIWNVKPANEAKTAATAPTLAEAIAVADELIANAKRGIEPTPAIVKQVVAEVAETEAEAWRRLQDEIAPFLDPEFREALEELREQVYPETPTVKPPRKPAVRRDLDTFDPTGKTDNEIRRELRDQTKRRNTPNGLRISGKGSELDIRPVESKNASKVVGSVTSGLEFGTWQGSITTATGSAPNPKTFPTMAEAITYVDDEITRILGRPSRTRLGFIEPGMARNQRLSIEARDAILDRAGARVGPGGSRISDNDLSHVGAAHRIGQISDRDYAVLTRWVDYDGEKMKLWEAYERALHNSPATMDEAERIAWAKQQVAEQTIDPRTKAQLAAKKAKVEARTSKAWRANYKALSAYQTWLKVLREGIMYNWARGFGSMVSDRIGNAYAFAINGELIPAAKALNIFDGTTRELMQQARGRKLVKKNLPDYDWHTRVSGKEPPRNAIGVGDSRTETGIGEVQLKRTGKVYRFGGRMFAEDNLRALRTGADHGDRYTLYMHTFRKNHRDALQRFRGMVIEQAGRTGNDVDEWVTKLDNLGDGFGSADVLDAFGNTRLARDWTELMSQASVGANKRVNDLLFTYKSTGADDLARNVLFFHYWMSRAAVLHAKTALRNPYLLNAYARAWDYMEKEAEANGYPPNVIGFVRMMGSESGMYGLVSPASVLIPFWFLIEGAMAEGDPGTMGFIQRWGGFINPLVEAAAAALLGQGTNVPDITATRQVRRALRYTVNWLNSNGYEDLVPNQLGDPNTWQTSVVDQALYGLYNGINDLARRGANAIAPTQNFIRDYEGTNPSGGEYDTLNSIVINQLEQTYGPFATWEPDSEPFRLLDQAMQDIELGTESNNPLAADAIEEFADAKGQSVLLTALTPGGVYQRYGPRDQTLAEARAGEDQAYDQREIATSGNPTLAIQMTELDRLGTEAGRQGYALWNEIVYTENLEPGYIVVDGQAISTTQVEQMDEDDRKELADRWLAQYEGVPEAKDEYDALRKTYLDTHPEAGDFKEYQSGVSRYEGGPNAWRQMFAKDHEQFAEAMQDAEDRFREQGKTGTVLDAEMEQWTRSPDAYNAAIGERESVYDEELDPTAPDFGFEEQESGGSSGGGKKSDDPMESVKNTIERYEKKLDEALTKMQAAGYNVTRADLDAPNDYYRSVFASFGVPTEMPEDYLLYQQWKVLQPPGVTVEGFINWLRKQGEQQAAA